MSECYASGVLRVEPAFHGGDFVFADNDFLVGGGCHVDAHLAKEKGREFLDGGSTDDVLTVHAHEALRIELTLYFFERHVQGMVFAFHCT